MYDAITDVSGLKVGHYTDLEAGTGCTVILAEDGATPGVDVRGSAPGSRETDLMRPGNFVQVAHAIVLSGGSAFGLDSATGVMRYLEERGIGVPTRVMPVPIVGAAVLYDLDLGNGKIRPDHAAGYAACQAASSGPVAEGCVGVGTGCRLGNLFGSQYATKGGLGTASVQIAGGVVVAAVVAVNAFGDVVDPNSGEIIAGARDPKTGRFVDTMRMIQREPSEYAQSFLNTNTTLGVVATNAILDKEGTNKVAQMAHDGLAMTIRPVHTMGDGDAIFTLATGKLGKKGDITIIGAMAAQVMARAVVKAVKVATSLYGLPCATTLAREAKS